MDSAKKQKIAKLLQFEENTALTAFDENERRISDIEEIKDDAQKIVEAINELDQKKANKVEVENLIASIPTVKGDRGFKGEKGDPGRDGKDGRDGIDGLSIKGDKGDRGEIGLTGKNGKDGSPDTPDQVIEKIHSSKKLIKKEKIEGIDDIEAKIQIIANRPQIQGVGGGASGIREVRAGSGISVTNVNDIITVSAPGSTTDEKVKYDANDPTAGYVADKFVAGTGITLSEGTGADENKLKITNSAPAGSWGALNYPTWSSGTPFVKMTAAGTFALDTNTYLTSLTGAMLLDQTTPQTITGGQPIQDTLTASQIVATDANKKLQTLAVDTYPSLTELSYVKGVTSAIQTQLGTFAKLDGTNQPFTGDININKVLPEFRLTTSGDTNYSRLKRSVTNMTTSLSGIVSTAGSADLNSGLVLHFLMNDNAASKVILDNKGTYNGTSFRNTNLLSVAGVINQAIDFNGTSDYITVADNAALELSNKDFAISFWVKVQNTSGDKRIVDFNSVAGGYAGFLIYQSGSTIQLYGSSNGTSWDMGNAVVIGSVSAGVPAHILVTRNGNVISTYLNNVPGGTVNTSASYYNGTNGLVIGRWQAGASQYYRGFIDDFRYYLNAGLSAGQITAIYNAGSGTESEAVIINNTEQTALSLSNGISGTETASIQLGATAARTTIEGVTTRFNVSGAEKIQLASTGLNFIDSFPINLGSANDGKLVFTGTQLQLQSDLVTSTDSLLLRGGTNGVMTAVGATTQLTITSLLGTYIDAFNMAFGTTTGTKIGTATNQKLGFFNATPVVQQTAATDLGTTLSNLGLRASGTAYPITTSGAVSLTGDFTHGTGTATFNNGMTIADAKNIILNTTTGTKIGTATTQKLGFFNATPVVQQTGVAEQKTNYVAGDLDTEAKIITALNTTNTAINTLRTALNALGLTSTV